MASDTEADGMNFNGDCDYDDDDAAGFPMSPMSSLLVPEIAFSDGNFDDDANDDFDDATNDVIQMNGGSGGGDSGSFGDDNGGQRSYKCDVCDKVFKRKAHLRRHYRLHTGERPYDCQWCGQSFARSEQRNQHIAREHHQHQNKSNPIIACTICNKTFRSDEERMNHMVLHLENKYFRCTLCPKEFDKASALAGHMHVHTANEPISVTKKSYRCATCDMEFTRFDHLIRHQTVHSGEKMHQCKFCMKRFTRADNRTKHEKTCRIAGTSPTPTTSAMASAAGSAFNESGSGGDLTNDITIKTEPDTSDDPLAIINVSSIPEHYFEDIDTSNNTDDLLDSIDLFNENDGGGASGGGVEDSKNGPNGLLTAIRRQMKSAAAAAAAAAGGQSGVINPMEYVRMKQSEADQDLKKLGGIRQKVERPKLTADEIQTLTCNVCGKTLAQKYHLVRHKIIHLKQKPYKCLRCARSFARREHLRHHLFTHKRQTDRMDQLKQQHKKDRTLATPASPPPLQARPGSAASSSSSLQFIPHLSQKLSNKRRLDPMPTVATVSKLYKRDESLTENLRQQLLHRFKLFAIKLKHENMNGESGDFYEQCFNFLGNLIMSNIQGVRKEMFSSNSSSMAATTTTTMPMLPASLVNASNKTGMTITKILKPTIKQQPPQQQRPAVPTVTIKREDGTFVKKFTCNVCHASLPSLKHLERHSIQHTGEKPHICEICGNRFTRAEHKRRHMAIHTNAQNYECEICTKKFNRSDHMVAHFKVHHQGIKPYKCKFLCGERFDTFKEKLFHSRHCLYLPPGPDSIDKDDDVDDEDAVGDDDDDAVGDDEMEEEEIIASSCDSQDNIPMVECGDPFANGQSSELGNGGGDDAAHQQFQSHFIKTETDYTDDNYDEMYGY